MGATKNNATEGINRWTNVAEPTAAFAASARPPFGDAKVFMVDLSLAEVRYLAEGLIEINHYPSQTIL
jgi:hypothetical protein